ncbi:MAG: EAL domain-containing protein [Acidobacteriota bacterium]
MVAELVDLHAALENDQVVPYFQPLVALRTGKLTGFEVLARWDDPAGGPRLPSNFVTLAEQNGLIGALTRQVFGKAFAAAAAVPAPLSLSVNISPVQMHYLSLPGQIRALADEAGFPLDRLILEITESAFFNNVEQAKTIAAELKAMGCRLALDDFGTGYSNLSHLLALSFDELKVDRSFVGAMTDSRNSRKVVAAIVGLATSLGLVTVAEGVETEEQADMLLCLGCELGQGWLYGKPVGQEQLAGMVSEAAWVSPFVLTSPGDGWAVSSLEALPTQRLAQLQAIYDGAPVGLCFLDRDLRYVSLNKKLAEMNGTTVSAHLGRRVQEMVPEMYAMFEPHLLQALQGLAIEGFEVIRPAKVAGEQGVVTLVSYQPAWDEADEVIGISVSVVDITQHKRTEAALLVSEDHRQQMEEQTKQVPWVMDAEGNSLQVSSHWVQEAGVHKGKPRNLGWLEALHGDDLAPTLRTMKEALRTGKPIDIQYRVCVDDVWRWMRSRGTARLGAGGEILRWYGTVEDVGEERLMGPTAATN